ncbi:MAG TPA: hypothetical protein VF093_08090, partial [Solirubrobacterales bacterium]
REWCGQGGVSKTMPPKRSNRPIDPSPDRPAGIIGSTTNVGVPIRPIEFNLYPLLMSVLTRILVIAHLSP